MPFEDVEATKKTEGGLCGRCPHKPKKASWGEGTKRKRSSLT